VLRVDTVTDAVSLFGAAAVSLGAAGVPAPASGAAAAAGLQGGAGKWDGAVLAGNGCVYAVPFQSG
jgi:hypothetical protein